MVEAKSRPDQNWMWIHTQMSINQDILCIVTMTSTKNLKLDINNIFHNKYMKNKFYLSYLPAIRWRWINYNKFATQMEDKMMCYEISSVRKILLQVSLQNSILRARRLMFLTGEIVTHVCNLNIAWLVNSHLVCISDF